MMKAHYTFKHMFKSFVIGYCSLLITFESEISILFQLLPNGHANINLQRERKQARECCWFRCKCYENWTLSKWRNPNFPWAIAFHKLRMLSLSIFVSYTNRTHTRARSEEHEHKMSFGNYLRHSQHHCVLSNTKCMPTNERLTCRNIIVISTLPLHIPNIYPIFVRHGLNEAIELL